MKSKKILPRIGSLLLGAACGGLLLTLGLPSFKSVQAETVAAQIGKLHDANHRPAAERLQGGKPTLVKFWASWCPLCLSELGRTEQWTQDKRFQSANLITIASPGYLHEKPEAEFRHGISETAGLYRCGRPNCQKFEYRCLSVLGTAGQRRQRGTHCERQSERGAGTGAAAKPECRFRQPANTVLPTHCQ